MVGTYYLIVAKSLTNNNSFFVRNRAKCQSAINCCSTLCDKKLLYNNQGIYIVAQIITARKYSTTFDLSNFSVLKIKFRLLLLCFSTFRNKNRENWGISVLCFSLQGLHDMICTTLTIILRLCKQGKSVSDFAPQVSK